MVALASNPKPKSDVEVRLAEAAWRTIEARWAARFSMTAPEVIDLRAERWAANYAVLEAYHRFYGEAARDIIPPNNIHRRVLAEQREIEALIKADEAYRARSQRWSQERVQTAREKAVEAGLPPPFYDEDQDGIIFYAPKQQEEDTRFALTWAELNDWPQLDLEPTVRRFRSRVARPELYQAVPIYLTIASGEKAWRGLLRWLPHTWKYLPMLIREHLDS